MFLLRAAPCIDNESLGCTSTADAGDGRPAGVRRAARRRRRHAGRQRPGVRRRQRPRLLPRHDPRQRAGRRARERPLELAGPADQLRHRAQRPPDRLRPRRQRRVLHATTTARSRRSTAAPATTASRSARSSARSATRSEGALLRRRRLPGADRDHPRLAQPGHPRAARRAGRHRQRRVHRLLEPGRAQARGRRRQRHLRRPRLRARRGRRHRHERRRRARPERHRGSVRHSTRTRRASATTALDPNRPLNASRPRHDNNGDGVCNAADAHLTTDPDEWHGRHDPARRQQRRAPDHRPRLLDGAAARHPRRRRRGRGLVQRQRAGLGRRRHAASTRSSCSAPSSPTTS